MSDDKSSVNPYMGIAGSIGGISVGIVALVAIFASDHMAAAAWIVGSLAAMGVALGYFASKRTPPQ